jgi:protein TonB
MVRSAYLPRKQPNPERIAAISVSIMLNVALFGFLMQPASYAPPKIVPDKPHAIPYEQIKIKPLPKPPVVKVEQKHQDSRPTSLTRLTKIDIPQVIKADPGPIDIPVPPQPPQVLLPPGDGEKIGPPMTVDAYLSPIVSPAPSYPIDAVRDGSTGTVQLEILVGVDGSVIDVRVVKSSGDRRLDAAARDQVLRHWQFKAAVENGVPVQARGILPVVFSLNGQ